jgi:hypothetical protein
MGILDRQSRQGRFWDWFQRNSDRLVRFEDDQEALFLELNAELLRVHKGLTFEIGPLEGGKREFIVSADGVRAVFPAVQQLVAAAPAMPSWTVIAFRQRKSLELVVAIDDVEVGAGDLWFSTVPDRGRLGLRLYMRGLTGENRRVMQQVAIILLDCALGEYDVATKVGFIEFHPLPEDPAALGLQPFSEIREIVG